MMRKFEAPQIPIEATGRKQFLLGNKRYFKIPERDQKEMLKGGRPKMIGMFPAKKETLEKIRRDIQVTRMITNAKLKGQL